MKIFRLLLAIVPTILLTNGALADEAEPNARRLSIGSTGVLCYMEPCPWRGVVDLNDQNRDPLRPIWDGAQVPSLSADAPVIEQIRAVWEARQCIEVEGAVVETALGDKPPVLRVDKIVGDCA